MTDVLKREAAIADNRDPRGVKWGVFPQKGRALYLVRATKKDLEGNIVADEKYDVPAECLGEWTVPHKAQFQIERFLERIWNESDAAAQKNARKVHREEVEDAANQSG